MQQTETPLKLVLDIVQVAGTHFSKRLQSLVDSGGISKEQYVRYLSMQYHLTKGVQKHFLIAASHPTMVGKRKLREFLFHFGLEEEPHYGMAKHDLQHLGAEPLPCPIDVKLWWAYFDQIISQRPFVRLGATCILENLGGTSPDMVRQIFANSGFINRENSTFLILHLHETLPHGEQILSALESVPLDTDQLADLAEGARIGAVLYLRMSDWALGTSTLVDTFFGGMMEFQTLGERIIA